MDNQNNLSCGYFIRILINFHKKEKKMENIIDFIEFFEKKYPDLMILENKSEFERGKDAGFVLLLKEMRAMIEKDR